MKKLKIISSVILSSLLTTGAVFAWVNLSNVGSGDTLTATIWNSMIAKINENGNKLEGIYNVGGNIGIGNSDPYYSLDILKTTQNPTSVRVKNTYNGASSDPGIIMESLNSNYKIFANDETNQLYFWDMNTSTPRMTILGSGNVGIGTTNPLQRLDVNGAVRSDYLTLTPGGAGEGGELRLEGDTGYGDIQFDNFFGNVRIHTLADGKQFIVGGGSALANAWNVTSDIRKKDNIIPLENIIEKIKNIRGVRFTWKESGKKDIGVIAQEIEKEFPEFVTTASDGYKSVDYGKLTSILIEGIKQQQEQIDNLNQKYKQLSERLNKIENSSN